MPAMPVFDAPAWRAPPGVRALLTMRDGGGGNGPWSSLNLATHVGDAPAAVAENRRRLRAAAGLPGEPCWLKQVHGIAVADLDVLPACSEPEADAAITTQPGTVCAVLTADCLPVLFAAGDGTVVGAAHAGWRGLAAGVLEQAVAAMRARVAPGIALQAFIGPAIGPRHFEVGPEVRDAFIRNDPKADAAFTPGRPGHWSCDLLRLARARLAALGVEDVTASERCTYEDEARCFSHRRDVQHRGLASTGRLAALIWRQP
jgi:hypothetical protein